MFKNIVAKLRNEESKKIEMISKDEVVLKALCAYRDVQIMSDDSNLEELCLIGLAIDDIVQKIHQES
jgi:hypothetical protein